MSKEHPSHATLSFSRVGGRYSLFECPTRTEGAIELRICTARIYTDGERRVHDDKLVVRVLLSATQFAQALTCMNQGSGVPATLAWANGQYLPEPPLREVDEVLVDSAVHSAEQLHKYVQLKLAEISKQLAAEAARPTPRKAVLEALIKEMGDLQGRVKADVKFGQELLTEKAAALSQQVKAEVHATTDMVLRQLGAKALNDKLMLGQE
jgi:hypothetical protein